MKLKRDTVRQQWKVPWYDLRLRKGKIEKNNLNTGFSYITMRIIMVILAVMVLWMNMVKQSIRTQQQQVIWPANKDVGILGNRKRVIALRFSKVDEDETRTKRDDGESRNISTSISEYGSFGKRGIGYGWVYRKQVVWPTLIELEYRVKQRCLPSLRLAESNNQRVFYLSVKNHYELTGSIEYYFSRDTDVACQKLSKCRRYTVVNRVWRIVTGSQPNCASQDEVGSFLFYSLWSLAGKIKIRQIVFGSCILVVQKLAVVAVRILQKKSKVYNRDVLFRVAVLSKLNELKNRRVSGRKAMNAPNWIKSLLLPVSQFC